MTAEPATTTRRPKPNKFDLDELLALIADGWSIPACSDVLNVSLETVRKWLIATGTPFPPTTFGPPAAGGGIPDGIPDLTTEPRGPAARPRTGWAIDAACAGIVDSDDDPFHPATSDTRGAPSAAVAAAYERARSYCRLCPVTVDCLVTGIAGDGSNYNDKHGMWGGLTPHQRRGIRGLEQATRPELESVIGMVLAQDASTAVIELSEDCTPDVMLSAAAAYQRWRRGAGPSLTLAERGAYRAFCRARPRTVPAPMPTPAPVPAGRRRARTRS